jgi:formylglycine-generating enzyme required for sulfatase activity
MPHDPLSSRAGGNLPTRQFVANEASGSHSDVSSSAPASERYAIVEQIGVGGMGSVWKAVDQRFQQMVEQENLDQLNRFVALKRILPELARDEQFLKRFRRETLTVAALQHPHVVQVLDFDEDEDGPFLIMQWIDGHDLNAVVQNEGPLEPSRAAGLLAKVADALHAAHQQGIAHRDIKPNNILLGANDHPYLTDFGLAIVGDSSQAMVSRITLSGQAVGTPHFMPPEGSQSDLNSGILGDIWSLGKTLYYITTGRLQLQESQIPEAIRDLITTATCEFPHYRYQNMAEFATALRGVASGRAAVPDPSENQVRTAPAFDVTTQTPAQNLPDSSITESPPDEWRAAPNPGVWGRQGKSAREEAETANRTSNHKLRPVESKARLGLSPTELFLRGGAAVVAIALFSAAFIQSGTLRKAPQRDRETGNEITVAKKNEVSQKTPITSQSQAELAAPQLLVSPFASATPELGQADCAASLGLPVEWKNSLGMAFRLIPPGEYEMGSAESEDGRSDAEGPQHKVRITRPSYLQSTVVTQGHWKQLMGTSPWSGESLVKEGSDYPAVYVSWDDAVAFCRRLSEQDGEEYRLPTEAEWEWACRAGSQTAYGFGDDSSQLGAYGWFEENADDIGEAYAHRVGEKKPNGFGLYDMHGNVWEWSGDWFDKDWYGKSTVADPQGPSTGSLRVIRGGSWDFSTLRARSACRDRYSPDNRDFNLGFRVLRSSVLSSE